jgi:hypothetical protein
LEFQEIRTTNDLFFTVVFFLNSKRISYITDELIEHRFSIPGSLSNSREKSYDCCLVALKALQEFLLSNDLYCVYEHDFINYTIHFLDWNISTMKGSAYFDLFRDSRKYLSSLDVDVDFIYDEELIKIYENMMSLSELDYLFWIMARAKGDADSASRRLAVMEKGLIVKKG